MKSFSVEAALRPHIRSLKPYSSARHEFTGEARIYLDANENPFKESFNRYPDPDQQELKTLISKIKNIEAKRIFTGNGSDEAIDLLIRAFCEPGVDHIITTPPTYGMYKVCAAINNVKNIEMPLSKDFSVSADEILKQVNSFTKIIFLCSPNNPTGNSIPSEVIIQILKQSGVLVVVDEAYIDFSAHKSLVTLREYKNLIILQTLSKAYGLAGLRIGLALGAEEIISTLNRIKPPYNISSASQAEAIKLLCKNRWQEQIAVIISEREKLKYELTTLNFVKKVFPSDANFLLTQVSEPKACYQYLKANGIIVRDRSEEMHCSGCLRISIGTPDENHQLMKVLRDYKYSAA